jgi:quinoprotein glucose dehydrogenase
MSRVVGRLLCWIAVLGCAAVVDRAAVAQERPSASADPPKQVVTERSPIGSDTTFIYRFRKSASKLAWSSGDATLVVTQLPVDDREYRTIAALRAGDFLQLERSPVWKLTTGAPLVFGSTTLPLANVAPDYPGTYAVWLRRTAQGWEALFNDEGDAWGTQHDPAYDRGAVALSYASKPDGTGALTGVLEGEPSAAVLRLTWGEHEWTTPFHVLLGATGVGGTAAAGSATFGDAAARDSMIARTPAPRVSATRTEWTHHGNDLGANRYAPLDQIDANNVSNLSVAWRWASPDEAIRAKAKPEELSGLASRRHEAIPLAIGGRLYTVTSLSQLAAIDAATGETLWVFDPESWRAGPPTNLGFVHRGCAYWRDRGARQPATGEERLLYASTDSWLYAIDARTGKPVATFGDGGRVDLIANIPLARRAEGSAGRGNFTVSSPPLVVRDVVIVGSSIADRPNTIAMPRGDVRGFDVRTGKLAWTFHTVPQGGEQGAETLKGEAWRKTGNANVWTLMSGDEELGLAFLPISTPTSDYYGGYRKGAGLFAESLVAVDATTGERRWHFQMVHHGLWDYDLPAAANVVDVEIGGRAVRAVAQVSKQGFTYVFDRATGRPVWPIEERPVVPSSVPGEEAWPTQPFPTRPPAFERQGASADDVIDWTPELRAEALAILDRYEHGSLFIPPSERGTLQLPGSAGGANWGGAVFDPDNGVLYVPSLTVPIAASVAKGDPRRTEFEWVGDRVFGYSLGEPFGPRGLPLFKPPYARVTAIDLRRGEILWQSPVGQGPRRQVEKLIGKDPGPLGSSTGLVHALATRTLVLATKQSGRTPDDPGGLWAFAKSDGRLVAFIPLDAEPGGSPITYIEEGRQYVVVATQWRDGPQELIALALPTGTD